MSRRYVSANIRLQVKERAIYCCEYCKLPELFSFIGFELDHIIPLKHGGNNNFDNLAWACAVCNNCKGTDVGTFLLPDLDLIRFYHPRLDNWEDHFELSRPMITPKTNIGEATIKIFQFNHPNRLDEREALCEAGFFPPPDYPLLKP